MPNRPFRPTFPGMSDITTRAGNAPEPAAPESVFLSGDGDELAALWQSATLEEYAFTSAAPVVGGLVVRLREAWNGVATKWQARPWMEQQSAFNRALAMWLAQPPGVADLDERLVEQDRRQTALGREIALSTARVQPSPRGRRLRLAYFSPMPPSHSGIADYSAALLPHLAQLADVTVFASNALAQALNLPVASPGDYASRRAEFDIPLYQMGNSDQHEAMYDVMVRFPGVVVLHDYVLHHFIRHHTAGRGDWTGYGREMAYAMSRDGRRLAHAVHEQRAAAPLFDAPLNERLIDASLGLVVHSEYVAERVRSRRPACRLRVIPHLVEERAGRSLRAQLGLPDRAVLFGSFGHLTAEKRIDAALRAFRRVRDDHPDAHYLLVGEAQPDLDIDSLVAELEPAGAIRRIGYVRGLPEFDDWIRTVDVVVNLRQPTVGETSGVALRAMAAGRPLIVYDRGWYAELPDDAALKIPPGDEEALREAMERLAASAELRRAMGRAGREYVRNHCHPERIARAYVDFLESTLEPVA